MRYAKMTVGHKSTYFVPYVLYVRVILILCTVITHYVPLRDHFALRESLTLRC